MQLNIYAQSCTRLSIGELSVRQRRQKGRAIDAAGKPVGSIDPGRRFVFAFRHPRRGGNLERTGNPRPWPLKKILNRFNYRTMTMNGETDRDRITCGEKESVGRKTADFQTCLEHRQTLFEKTLAEKTLALARFGRKIARCGERRLKASDSRYRESTYG